VLFVVDVRLLRVVRPHIVVGGFLGYSLGALLALNAGGGLTWAGFLLGYLIVLFGDLSTHYNNDYFDVEIDRDAPPKPFGTLNVLVEHAELRTPALYASAGFTVLSVAAASVAVLAGSPMYLLLLVATANLFGWLYSAPPPRLNSRGLGEVVIALGTGFCVPAVGYIVARGAVDGVFLLFSAPLMLYGFVLSLCLQVPDIESDRAMGKRTLAGVVSRRGSYLLVLVSSVAAFAWIVFLVPDVTGLLWAVPLISLVPVASSLFSVLLLNDSRVHARLFTRVNVSALFLLLVGLDAALLLGLN
jgi:1,4-dihydroxy-2-naphthoate octaprenyltransferase